MLGKFLMRSVNRQVQIYLIFLKNTSMGIMNFNLARNLLMYQFSPFGYVFSSIQFSDPWNESLFQECLFPKFLKYSSYKHMLSFAICRSQTV